MTMDFWSCANDDLIETAQEAQGRRADRDDAIRASGRPSLRSVQMFEQREKNLRKSMAFAFRELHPISDWDAGMSPAQWRTFVHG
jgi:hypothetical protein